MSQRQWFPLCYQSVDDLPIGYGPGKIPTSDMVVNLIGTNSNIYLPVRNTTGGPLLKGRLVVVTGSVGTGATRRYLVDYADKDNGALRPASAVLQADLPDASDAYAIVAGVLTEVDTSAFALTDQLCLGNAGAFLRPPPDTDPFTGEVQLCGVVLRVGVADGAIQVIVQGLDVLTAAAQFNAPQTLGRGWQEGGDFARGVGLDLDIAGGIGFVTGATPTELIRVIWPPQTITLAADSALHVYVDEFGVAQSNTTYPDTDKNIILGHAFTEAASIPFLSADTVQVRQRNRVFNQFASEVTGCIAVSGVIATPVGLGVNVSSGVFWANDDREPVVATVGATWTYWYRDGLGGWTAVLGQAAIDTAFYDDGSGVLAAIPAGEWKQDILYAAVPVDDTSVEYHVVYAQATFTTQPLAEEAPVPTPFGLLQTHALRSTGLVVQEAAVAIASAVDQRPFLGGLATGVPLTDFSSILGTITDLQHGNRGGGALHALVTGLSAGFMSSADFTKLAGITPGAAVASVGGTAPIVSSGGTTPNISITAATALAAGSLSAADFTKLSQIMIAAGGSLSIAGGFGVTFTATALTALTLPTTGTLVSSTTAAGGDLAGTYPNPTVASVGGATAAVIAGSVAPETVDYLLLPEGRTTGNATRVAQTTYEGATYILRKRVTFDRILFRITGMTAGATVAIHIFQAANGLSGNATRVATVTAFAIGATGNFEASLAEGSVTLAAGLCYILFGRDSAGGSATFRTYTTQGVDLLTANVQVDTHPTSFTTAIAATTTPATFNPVTQATGTASDVTGVFRLLTN